MQLRSIFDRRNKAKDGSRVMFIDPPSYDNNRLAKKLQSPARTSSFNWAEFDGASESEDDSQFLLSTECASKHRKHPSIHTNLAAMIDSTIDSAGQDNP